MATWKDDIVQVLKNQGGVAHLSKIFEELETIRKEDLTPNWHRTVQKELERFSSHSDNYEYKEDLFYMAEGKGKGVWGLRKHPMKFFVVFQGDTYEEERDLSCLWAPKLDKRGGEQHHHKRLLDINIGDRVIHLKDRKIMAISTAIRKAYDAECPREFKRQNFSSDGRMVDLELTELDDQINVNDIFDKIRDYLPEKYSPFIKHNGKGNQGYLFEISANIFNIILDTDFDDQSTNSNNANKEPQAPKGESTVNSISVNRRSSAHQQYFKNQLLNHWGIKCVLTGITNKDLLIGAHIKPWTKSNEIEKIDKFNGLPLTPNADKLFELGYISFDNNGNILISNSIDEEDLKSLGINTKTKLNISSEHTKYLEYHRTNKFKKS